MGWIIYLVGVVVAFVIQSVIWVDFRADRKWIKKDIKEYCVVWSIFSWLVLVWYVAVMIVYWLDIVIDFLISNALDLFLEEEGKDDR